MKLWLIWQDVNSGWDTYDSAVVVAENEEAARNIHPNGGPIDPEKASSRYYDWASAESVKATYLGEAAPDNEPGDVICSSFNAG